MGATTAPVQMGVAVGTLETAANTPGAVVRRDGSGNFAAGTISAALAGNVTGNVSGNVTGNVTGNVAGNVSGNAGTATALQTSRDFALAGDVTSSAAGFNGTGNVTLTGTIANGAVTPGKLSSGVFQTRAWVNFNATQKADNSGGSSNGDDVLIRASGNVASVNRVAVSVYAITFSSALADASYAFFGSVGRDNSNQHGFVAGRRGTALATWKTASALTVSLLQDGGTDMTQVPAEVNVVVLR